MLTHKQRIENALALKENDRTPYSCLLYTSDAADD